MLCYGMLWHVMAWHGMAWHGMAWHGMAWHGMAWHCMAWHGMAWHGMAWHGMAWHGMALLVWCPILPSGLVVDLLTLFCPWTQLEVFCAASGHILRPVLFFQVCSGKNITFYCKCKRKKTHKKYIFDLIQIIQIIKNAIYLKMDNSKNSL